MILVVGVDMIGSVVGLQVQVDRCGGAFAVCEGALDDFCQAETAALADALGERLLDKVAVGFGALVVGTVDAFAKFRGELVDVTLLFSFY